MGWTLLVGLTTAVGSCGTRKGSSASPPPPPPKERYLPPTLDELQYPDRPEKLTLEERNNYAQIIAYDGREGGNAAASDRGGQTEEVDCEDSTEMTCTTAKVEIRIDPAIGTHKLADTNVFKGWRIVAKITLVDKNKVANYPPLKLTRAKPVVYWFVGPDAADDYIESRYYNTFDKDPIETNPPLRYWKRGAGGGNPGGPKAVFKKDHHGQTPVEFRKGGGGGGGGGGATASSVVRTRGYGLMWFECDPGCCG